VNTKTTDLLCWYGPCAYTSARLITRDRLEVAYGRVEARLKLPRGAGIWPAFWMLGADLDAVGWPQSGEIDIIENVGREPGTVHGTIHGPGYSGGSGIGHGYDLPGGGAFADDFHIFTVEWRPDEIRWFVDGVPVFTVTPEDIPSGTEWVYNHPFFLILNVAVGGNWPGPPDESTTFPQTMLVDYVRVYGAPGSAKRYSAAFVDDVAGWRQIDLPFAAFADAEGRTPSLADIWGYGLILPADSSGSFLLDQLRFLD
jgi:beta-glucanase (GH16 family)